MTIKVVLMPGHSLHYHSHEHRDEIWTVISGTGIALIDEQKRPVAPGDVISMPAGCRHTVFAHTELEIIEVQVGSEISVEDKQKYELPEDCSLKREN